MKADDLLSIGEVAHRSGLAPSALRYYEDLGLITSTRTAGDRRRYRRAVLRRLAVIRSAQNVGLSLDEIAAALATLHPEEAPTKREWHRISAAWRPALDARIAALQALRANLDTCIGCGCLSMRQCSLYNPQDELGETGPGPRRKVAVLDPAYDDD
ncbi:MAG TPA: redox-sensitive transcriptional activator SoxR [Candidatus Nanopelagicales bacterium]|nr:redox-sensitive transcriptional activator SoxR [Candidatus Nanopelagicales bacterium]